MGRGRGQGQGSPMPTMPWYREEGIGGDVDGSMTGLNALFGNLANNTQPGAWSSFLENTQPRFNGYFSGNYPADDIIDSEYRINNPIWGGGGIPQPLERPPTRGRYDIPEDGFWDRKPIRGGPWMPPIMPSPPRGGKGGRRPPWSPPFRPPQRPPQRPQMPAFGWISPTGVTPEYRSWMPGMSFAAERSYRNPARPFPIPKPITRTPTLTPPPAFNNPYPFLPSYGGESNYVGSIEEAPEEINRSGGGKINALSEGIATGMAIGGRTGYQGAGAINIPGGLTGLLGNISQSLGGTGADISNIGDYYGIGGGNLAIPPQAGMRSYGALPSPEGYRPGLDAEWNYFPLSNVPTSAYGQTGQTPYTGNVMGDVGGLAGQGWSGIPYSTYQSLFSLPEDFDPSSLTLPPQGDVTSPPVQTPPSFEMPDFSNYLTREDLSSFDFSDYIPDAGGVDMSGYATQEDLQQGLGSFVPDLSSYVTQDQLGGYNPLAGVDWSQYLTEEDLSNFQPNIDLSNYLTDQDLTEFQKGLGSLYDHQFDPTTYDWSNIINEYGGQQEDFDPSSYDWSDIMEEYSIPFQSQNLPYQSTSQLAEIANNAALGVPGYLPEDRGAVGRIGRAGGGKQGLGFSRTPYQGLGEITTEQEVITTPPAQAEVIEETTEVTSEGDEELIQMAVLAIQGKHPSPDEVQKSFIERFGLDAWIAFRERVLQAAAQNPEATTEGMIQGEGTGMSDEIPGVVAGQEKIAVSPGEFIVPADVVSGIGDGSSDSGSDRLYEMMDRVRQARTGTTEQPRPLNKGGILPA